LVDFVDADIALQDIIWFIPLDIIKFGMKVTVIKYLRRRKEMARVAGLRDSASSGDLITGAQSGESMHDSLYSNRTSFIRQDVRKVGFGQKVVTKSEELQQVSDIQAGQTGQMLARHPTPTL
jgi:H+-transporting ATPase